MKPRRLAWLAQRAHAPQRRPSSAPRSGRNTLHTDKVCQAQSKGIIGSSRRGGGQVLTFTDFNDLGVEVATLSCQSGQRRLMRRSLLGQRALQLGDSEGYALGVGTRTRPASSAALAAYQERWAWSTASS